jgi:hypothetical protein
LTVGDGRGCELVAILAPLLGVCSGIAAVQHPATAHRALGCSKPRPHGKPKPSEPLAPDIDAQLLLESESKAWDAVVEQGSVNAKFAFVDKHTRR